jgi:Sap, sulfolipid-1-addressing protein
MAEALAYILPIAVGILVVPLPIAAVIVLSFSPRATANGLAFLAGWVLGLTAVGGLTLLLAAGGEVDAGGDPARWASAIKLLLGVALLFLAYRSFEKRPQRGEEPSPPAWMDALTSSSPPRALGLGALLAGANPKNLLLVASAMTGVALLGLPTGQTVIVLVVFVVVASIGVAIPVGYAATGGRKAREALASWQSWLVANNAVVVAVVFLVLGVWIAGASLAELI